MGPNPSDQADIPIEQVRQADSSGRARQLEAIGGTFTPTPPGMQRFNRNREIKREAKKAGVSGRQLKKMKRRARDRAKARIEAASAQAVANRAQVFDRPPHAVPPHVVGSPTIRPAGLEVIG